MKVMMKKSMWGSPDGIKTRRYPQGECEMPESLAKNFISAGLAEAISDTGPVEEKAVGSAPDNKDAGSAPSNKATRARRTR